MGQLIIELPLPDGSVSLHDENLWVELGNGVKLTTEAPEWIRRIIKARLQLILEIEGSPSDAYIKQSPVE
jgi:hypothetical protein